MNKIVLKNRISIIVVCYNHSKYVIDCLESILHQTYKNIQLLIVDDCSTDNSVEVISDWVQKNKYECTKIFQKENIGLIRNLNSCFEMIEGDFVRIIAADDFLHPESCEKSISKLLELGNSYGLVFSDTYFVNENSKIINQHYNHYSQFGNLSREEKRKEILLWNNIPALSVVMTKEALLSTGKYPENIILEDYFRWLVINEKYWLAYVPEKLSYYRMHNTNISSLRKDCVAKEDLYLKLIFSKDTYNKIYINSKIEKFYLEKNMNNELRLSYNNYIGVNKMLNIFIQYHLPRILYKVIKKTFNE